MRETLIGCLSHAPSWGPGPQPRHVPWPGNWAGDFLAHRPEFNPLSHTSQGPFFVYERLSVSDLNVISILEQEKLLWTLKSELKIEKKNWWEHIKGVNTWKSSERREEGTILTVFVKLSPSETILWVNRSLFLVNSQRKFYFSSIYSILQRVKFVLSSLAGVAQWIECLPANQKVTSSIPNLGHMPGLRARSQVGGTQEVSTHWCFSPSLSPSLLLSKNKQNLF